MRKSLLKVKTCQPSPLPPLSPFPCSLPLTPLASAPLLPPPYPPCLCSPAPSPLPPLSLLPCSLPLIPLVSAPLLPPPYPPYPPWPLCPLEQWPFEEPTCWASAHPSLRLIWVTLWHPCPRWRVCLVLLAVTRVPRYCWCGRSLVLGCLCCWDLLDTALR